MFQPKTFPFSVDLPGLIDLMGTSLYSRADAAIRELIQNAHDGIVRRRMLDIHFQGTICFVQDSEAGILRVEDDGIGLSPEEAEKYLGTLGVGITGMIRRESRPKTVQNDASGLIGQFGIGLLSAFLLSDNIVVESLRYGQDAVPIRWEADNSTIIRLSPGTKTTPGTTVILRLRPEQKSFAQSEETIEEAIRQYADFLQIPIFLNNHEQRINLAQPIWFEPEPDEDALLLALESWFHETPLCVIPIRKEKPITVQGALYVSSQRLPGFTDEARVATTIRRMIISRRIQGLMPTWAPFIRGVLELPECRPTASREELVRDDAFAKAKNLIEEILFDYFEKLAQEKPHLWQALLTWHRYVLAGSALDNERLRRLLRSTYLFSTHRGKMTFEEIVEKSAADPIFESTAEYVVWYHVDRRQETAMEAIFSGSRIPCVHATLIFEETLLAAMSYDLGQEQNVQIDCRVAVPGTPGFSQSILGTQNMEPLNETWDEFFESVDARFFSAECDGSQPVFAFLNERQDLIRTLDTLKKGGAIPTAFQRMIDLHLDGEELPRNEILLNRHNRLVSQALERSTSHPLASVLRVLVYQAIQTAGVQLTRDSNEQIDADLSWIAETLYK